MGFSRFESLTHFARLLMSISREELRKMVVEHPSLLKVSFFLPLNPELKNPCSERRQPGIELLWGSALWSRNPPSYTCSFSNCPHCQTTWGDTLSFALWKNSISRYQDNTGCRTSPIFDKFGPGSIWPWQASVCQPHSFDWRLRSGICWESGSINYSTLQCFPQNTLADQI